MDDSPAAIKCGEKCTPGYGSAACGGIIHCVGLTTIACDCVGGLLEPSIMSINKGNMPTSAGSLSIIQFVWKKESSIKRRGNAVM